MLVHISHDRNCKGRFDVYCEGKKLRSGEEYDLPEQFDLTFAEYNPAAGKAWFARVFLAFLAGIVRASFDDFSAIRCSQKRTEVRIEGAKEELEIRFFEGGRYEVNGAQATELSSGEVPLPKVKRRIFFYKAAVTALLLAALGGFIALIFLL